MQDDKTHRLQTLILGRLFSLCGPIALAAVWITVAISWHYNASWFNFYTGALSDFGGYSALHAYIYNYGIIITAVFLFLFSLSLVFRSRNKIETIGSAFSIVASVVLIQIGVYHEGTYPHLYVSYYYFLQQDASMILWGVGLLIRKAKFAGVFTLTISIVFLILGGTLPWPGAAMLETYGILTFGAWAFLMNSGRLTKESFSASEKV